MRPYVARLTMVLPVVGWMIFSAPASFGQAGAIDAERQGPALFAKHCRLCHSLERGKHGVGPSLYLLAGRKAGAVPGYRFTDAFKRVDFFWNESTLGVYLRRPSTLVSGTRSNFPGLRNRLDRSVFVGWLLRVTRPR